MIPKDCFLESLARCADKQEFIQEFYRRLTRASEVVREKFARTDFDRQSDIVLKSLKLIAGCAAGECEALQEMKRQATLHDRYHLNIIPDLYPVWKSTMISTAEDFDRLWDEDVEESWNIILDHVIKQMIKHY